MMTHQQALSLYLQKVTGKNPPNNFGTTPVHSAAEHGKIEVCELISKYVTLKNPVDNNGKTPNLLLDEYSRRIFQ